MMRRTKDKLAQFLACFEGWCKHFRAPAVELYDEPGAHPSREDRCLIRATGEWLEWLEANSQGPYPCIQTWDHGIGQHNPLDLEDETAMQGWRGTRTLAAIQIILHGPPEKFIFLEVDFDLANPGRGLLPLIGHGVEWLWLRLPRLIRRPTRKTNPYRIARMLRRAGITVERV
jgi:hypothetical protein